MGRFLPLILKNCWRNRRRTSLTIVSIAASLCLLGVLMAIYNAFYFADATPEQALRIIVRNRVSLAFPMPEFYRQKIKQVPGVREVGASQWFGGVYKDRKPENFFARFAIEPDKVFTLRSEMRVPADQKAAFQRERTACMVGRKLADKQGFKIGDRITIQGDIFPVNLDLYVRAIFEADNNDELLYFHMKYLEEAAKSRIFGRVGTFTILADSPESVPRIIKAVDEEFRNSPVQTRSESEQAFTLSFVSSIGNVKAFLLSICAAVTFTILLVSGNTMAMSVRERVREVGVLKTLGFTNGRILSLILGEALGISLLGGLLGTLLATALCGLVAANSPAVAGPIRNLKMAPPVMLACLVVALFVGLASSFVPAWNAARTPILTALRTVD